MRKLKHLPQLFGKSNFTFVDHQFLKQRAALRTLPEMLKWRERKATVFGSDGSVAKCFYLLSCEARRNTTELLSHHARTIVIVSVQK